jgi:hypothetical protein
MNQVKTRHVYALKRFLGPSIWVFNRLTGGYTCK